MSLETDATERTSLLARAKQNRVCVWALRISTLLAAFVLAALFGRLRYALPLVVAISLVYGATRHERPRPILEHSIGCGLQIVGTMIALFAILYAVAWFI